MESKNKRIGESEARSIWIEQARCHECARCHQVEARHPIGKGLGEGSGVPAIENVKRYNVNPRLILNFFSSFFRASTVANKLVFNKRIRHGGHECPWREGPNETLQQTEQVCR